MLKYINDFKGRNYTILHFTEIPGIPEYLNQKQEVKAVVLLNRRFLERSAIQKVNYFCYKLLVSTFRNL